MGKFVCFYLYFDAACRRTSPSSCTCLRNVEKLQGCYRPAVENPDDEDDETIAVIDSQPQCCVADSFWSTTNCPVGCESHTDGCKDDAEAGQRWELVTAEDIFEFMRLLRTLTGGNGLVHINKAFSLANDVGNSVLGILTYGELHGWKLV